MPKITFIGAGSVIFARNVLGDCMMTPALKGAEIALHDIDAEKLEVSAGILANINRNCNARARITVHTDRKKALENAGYVINAIQVGGYSCIVNDFEIPLKYGLKQTFADTLGIGGIFRALRTIPVMLELAKDMEEVCPSAWLLNYTNPMAMVTGAMLRATKIKTVGLCHSVQTCARDLLVGLGMNPAGIRWRIAGINHQAWLLEISKDGRDLYPEIKRRARERPKPHNDMVRYEIMHRFGYYVTESSIHSAEYMPYFIKEHYPGLADEFGVPIGDYKRWDDDRKQYWEAIHNDLAQGKELKHERTHEYASYILEAMETGIPCQIGGNVLNHGVISNLPDDACVEVPCLVDANGISPCYVGDLPPQCRALNLTNINVQSLAVEAALTRKKEHIYHAAMLDPHTAAELPIDSIVAICDELIAANREFLPEFYDA
ncbi:MAG: alpha-glucosidase/alpha-galactosidase [Bacteroidota bacterium]